MINVHSKDIRQNTLPNDDDKDPQASETKNK